MTVLTRSLNFEVAMSIMVVVSAEATEVTVL